MSKRHEVRILEKIRVKMEKTWATILKTQGPMFKKRERHHVGKSI
jgi:hypothetical protein